MATGMGVAPSAVADLMTATLTKYKKKKWTSLRTNLQKTTAFKEIFRKHKGVDDDDGGTSITFNLAMSTNGSFRFVGLGFTATLAPPGTIIQGTVPWAGWTYNWSFDGAEPAMNRGDAMIMSIMKNRYYEAVGDMIQGVERALWRVPAAGDNLSVLGIPYYVVKTGTAATQANANGFNGLVPSGYTTVAGINPTTYPQWANYADAYTAVSKDDLVRKMRRAAEMTDFMPLVDGEPEYEAGKGYGWYMNYPVYGAFVEVAESQNDDLGPDVASMDGGKVLFRRGRLDWLPALADDTTNPIYGIDWSQMYYARMPGWWEKDIEIQKNPQQPTMNSQHTVTRTNLVCTNRRTQCVLSTGTGLPTP